MDEVFDLLFKRRQFKPCPQGSNLMLVTFAEQLSHQFFSKEGVSRGYNQLVENSVSHIYGPDDKTRKALRSMKHGKLKTRIINGEEYPPYLKDAPGVTTASPEVEILFISRVFAFVPKNCQLRSQTAEGGKLVYPKWALGHKMSGISPLSFTWATIWLREHNRLCDILLKEHPGWSDERIYQTVRWIISGEFLINYTVFFR